MSHIALQRVVVRMLYDKAFADTVYKDPEEGLSAEDLSEEERSWVVKPDPRAYRIDPYRRSRSLQALLDEYPCASALVYAENGGPLWLDAFFSSEQFHRCIQQRGSLAGAFGGYLSEKSDHRVRSLARLERAIASLRRASILPSGDAGMLTLAPHLALIQIPTGTLELRNAIWTCLIQAHPDPVTSMVEHSPVLEDLPTLHLNETQPLLLTLAESSDLEVEVLTDALFQLLEAVERPVDRPALMEHLESLGLPEDEREEVLSELMSDGLIITL